MSSRRTPKSTQVHITRFSKKGHGIGQYCNQVQPQDLSHATPSKFEPDCSITNDPILKEVEVPFTIPGDKVQALVQRKRSGIGTSKLEQIIVPSPLRIEPKCVHFGCCGGCRWQQLTYADQLKIKQEQVEKLFFPLLNEGTVCHPIVACDPPWQYRNKMEFTFSSDASGKHFLGLIMDSSRGKVLNLTECHLVNPWFIQGLAAVRSWWLESGVAAYHPHTNSGSLRTLTVREGVRSGDRMVMLTVSGNPEFALHRHHLDSFTAFVRDAIELVDPTKRLSIFLRIQQAVKGVETTFFEMLLYGPDHIRETLHVQVRDRPINTLAFNVSPSAFFQPNTKQAERLYGLALSLLDLTPQSVVYDLYCGTGTLGICIAKQVKQVVGIEISPESSLDARSNAAKNGLTNVNILTGPVKDVLQMIREQRSYPMPDIVMVDPPRVGLDQETIRHLADLKPAKILYISCNPSTQVENIKELQGIGYRLVSVQPVDQFPHTVHIENIAILELAS